MDRGVTQRIAWRQALPAVAALVLLVGCSGTPSTQQPATTTVTVTPRPDKPAVAPTPTSPAETPATGEPTPPEEPPAQGQAAPASTTYPAFKTPSGNIECAYGFRTMECRIAEHKWPAAAQPDDCDLAWFGNEVSLDSTAWHGICRGDVGLVADAGSGKPELPYGTSNSTGDITCTSEETGLACTNVDTGAGFTLSRDRVDLR